MITEQQIIHIFPNAKDTNDLVKCLNEFLPQYAITSSNRLCYFLAQVGHESGGFKYRIENLNYSKKALLTMWKKYFPNDVLAEQYARKPEMIANRIYANRMGNDNEQSGDGWKFRGRGFIQLTGKSNYTLFSDIIGFSIDETVSYCETLKGAVHSACWFWDKNNLNRFCDCDDIIQMTKTINGGTIGLQERQELYAECKTNLIKSQ